jgi:hypothetical protein
MPTIEPEVPEFAASVCATEPDESEEIYRIHRSIFRERNYFRHPAGFLVVKMSRSKTPFWGITKQIFDAFAGAGSVDRRCRSRLNHVACADRGQDPVPGHLRFRPIADMRQWQPNAVCAPTLRCTTLTPIPHSTRRVVR